MRCDISSLSPLLVHGLSHVLYLVLQNLDSFLMHSYFPMQSGVLTLQ
ncbi:hypothetical protein [Bacteroides uniformis]|nr:hypothetical protein [Bacteroides uniformis]